MIEYKVVYKQLTQPLREQIFNLWSTNQIMPFDEMLKRIDQVVVVAMDGREVVGVTSVYVSPFGAEDKLYYYYRMFIKPSHRNRNITRTSPPMSTLTRDFLESYNVTPKPHGVVCVLENSKISDKLMTTLGWNYYGKNSQDLPIWYVDFKKD